MDFFYNSGFNYDVQGEKFFSYIFLLSASTVDELKISAQKYLILINEHPEIPLVKYCTESIERRDRPLRLGFAVESLESLKRSLEDFFYNEQIPKNKSKGKLAFIFTGLGSTYSGMGMNLYLKNFLFHKNIVKSFRLLSKMGYENPEKIFDRDFDLKASAVMPALFALEYSLFKMWKNYGVSPSAVAGHSVGEFSAGCSAGIFSLEDGLFMMFEMGKLLDSLNEKGAMAAVKADKKKLSSLIANRNIAVAAENYKNSLVISGAERDIEDFINEFKNKIKIAVHA